MLFTLLLLRSLLKFPERGRLGGVVQGWCLPGGDSTSILKVGFLRTDVAGAVAVIVAIAVTIGVYTTSVVHVCDVCDAIAASARLLKSSSRYFLNHDGASDGARTTNKTGTATEATTSTVEVVVVSAVVVTAVVGTAGIVTAGVVTGVNSISTCAAACTAGTAMLNTALIRCW